MGLREKQDALKIGLFCSCPSPTPDAFSGTCGGCQSTMASSPRWTPTTYPSVTLWSLAPPAQSGRLKVTFTNNYPAEPPAVRFLSSIYHPNVYKDGKICLDILTKKEWKPVYDLGTVLTSIRSLLCDPNPKDPANCDAAYEYIYDRHLYEMKVRECVRNSWLNPYDVYKKEE